MDDTGTTREAILPRRLELLLAGLLLAILLLSVYGAWSWNWLKGPIERRVSAATEREFAIDGPIEFDPGWRMRVVAHDVRLGNPEWARRTNMGRAGVLRLEFTLGQLLRQRVDLMSLERPRLSLERSDEGEANWVFPERRGRQWRIGELLVSDGRMELREPLLETDLVLNVSSGERATDQDRSPLLVDGEGTYRGVPFEVEGGVESPLELRDRERSFRIGLRMRAGATRADVGGELHSWIDLRRFDLALQLEGADMADLYPLLGIALPTTADYALEGRLLREQDHWEYLGIEGRVGRSDIAGDVSVDVRPERSLLTADLNSDSLYFPDLAGFIGVKPGGAEAQRRRDGRLLPQAEFTGEGLRAMDANVRLVARQMTDAPFSVEHMDATLELEAGRLRLDPLVFGLAGGRASTVVGLDGNRSPAAVDIAVDLLGLRLERLMGEDLGDGTRGEVAGRIRSQGRGNSVASLMGDSSGEIQLVLGAAHVGRARLAAWGLDGRIQERALGVGDDGLPINCGVADFQVVEGIATAGSLGVDAEKVVIVGTGEIRLREEVLDLRVDTHPKRTGLMALRAPLKIRGTFLEPDVGIDAGPLLLRGIAAVALYSLAPPAALLALVETGGEDGDCLPDP